jgi:two-component system response regulator DctR
MPGMTGTMLQNALVEAGNHLPIIFVTGHGDIPMAVEALKKGAYDFVEKPFDDVQLVSLVLGALESAGSRRRSDASRAANAARMALLSVREREVLERVLAGKPSRRIAEELFISVKTVEFHRARIMQKLDVASAAELFRLCLAGSQ